jgi:hypothetical protein
MSPGVRLSASLLLGALAHRVGGQQPAATAPGKPTPCDFSSDRFASDSLPGVGRVNFWGGGVVVHCPQRGITLHGDSAEAFPDHTQLLGHASAEDPRFRTTSNFLNYFLNDERVVAVGDVHAQTKSGSTMVGPQAEYKRAVPKIRPREQMNATLRPTFTIVQRDSTGKLAPPMTVIADHVFMDGDSLIYGGGHVEITRPADNLKDTALTATGDSAFIDQGKETMRLMRDPMVVGKRDHPFTLTGTLIDMFSKEHKLTRVISRANAKAVSDSMTLTADTIDLRVKNDLLDHAYAWSAVSRAKVVSPTQNMIADSLDVAMPGQQMQRVRALRRAFAQGRPDTSRFKVTPPDTSDWLRGDTIVAHFDTSARAPKDTSKSPRIQQLIALGNASSLYHMAPSDTTERHASLNYVTARDITVSFDSNKVATVTTVDSVSGVFVEARTDSATRRKEAAATPANGQAPQKSPPINPQKSPPITPAKPPPKPPTTAPLDERLRDRLIPDSP